VADIKINEKLVVSQTGTAEPVMASNVTIPAAGITGTLGSGVAFPVGHIIQVVYNTKDSGWVTSTYSDYQNSGAAISITPKKSTSKIVVQFQCDVWYSGTASYFSLQIRATGGMTNSNIMTSRDTGTHVSGQIGTAFHQALSPVVNTTSAVTFTMWAYPLVSGCSLYYPNNAYNNTGVNKVNMLAWEIAQ